MAVPREPARASIADLTEWLRDRADWLAQQLRERGGVLFRGFPVRDDTDFRSVAASVLPELQSYTEGQSPRTRLLQGVYTSTEYPPRFDITLHSELSYLPDPPRRLVFGCLIAPQQGGETPIVDCRKVRARMDPAVRAHFEEKGVRYVKNMHGNKRGMGKSWQDHFETDDVEAVEAHLRANGTDFRWLEDGTLWTAQTRPAFREHPVTGEISWHNQSNLWHVSNFPEPTRAQLLKLFGEEALPTHATFGDGSPIPIDELDHVRSVLWENASVFPWQEGDVLVLDNYLVAHGRTSFEGERKIVVAMG